MNSNIPVILSNILSAIVSFLLTTGVKVLFAAVILLIGLRLIKWLQKKIEGKAGSHHSDKTVMKTLAYLIGISLRVVLIICLIGFLGFDTSSITALIASFGVCIGLAVNGALGNIAGGVLIILTRPFRIDDYIEAQGVAGTVADIHLTCTKLVTPDNRVIFIPNGALSAGNVVNYSMKDTRRVDFTFNISAQSDMDRAKALIEAICNSHELVLKDPAPFVRMTALKGHANEITARVWVNSADYWTVNFDILEMTGEAFTKAGISAPIEQFNIKTLP